MCCVQGGGAVGGRANKIDCMWSYTSPEVMRGRGTALNEEGLELSERRGKSKRAREERAFSVERRRASKRPA